MDYKNLDTIPTQGSGDFQQSFTDNGWMKLPNGFIMQWGVVSLPESTSTYVNLPIPFPHKGLSVEVTPHGAWAGAARSFHGAWFANNAQIAMVKGGYPVDLSYIAIGY